MLGEVSYRDLDLAMGTAEIAWWALERARGTDLIRTAAASVLRFGFGGLDLARVGCVWAPEDTASAELALALGFREEGRLRSAWVVDGRRTDLVVAGLLTDDHASG